MEIHLVRHADALDAEPGSSDAERPLSDEGRLKMQKGARGLRNLLAGEFPALHAILASPKLRAVETARILAREVNGSEEVAECPPLASPFQWTDLLPHLDRYPPSARVALVGHEPDLGRLAGWLLNGQSETAVPLKKGSIVCFQVEGAVSRPAAELLWFLTPKQLRLLR